MLCVYGQRVKGQGHEVIKCTTKSTYLAFMFGLYLKSYVRTHSYDIDLTFSLTWVLSVALGCISLVPVVRTFYECGCNFASAYNYSSTSEKV